MLAQWDQLVGHRVGMVTLFLLKGHDTEHHEAQIEIAPPSIDKNPPAPELPTIF